MNRRLGTVDGEAVPLPNDPSPTFDPRPAAPAKPAASSEAGRIRVLVCDDSAFMRKALSQLITSDAALTVIDTARNGQEAAEKARALKPDVVTMDIEMPVLNGHEALKRIRRECRDDPGGPPAVLMCSSLTSAGSHDALQALREGAADVIAKDHSFFSTKMDAMRDDLVRKIKAVGAARARRAALLNRSNPESLKTATEKCAQIAARLGAGLGAPVADVPISGAMNLLGRRIDLVVIGSSTGGPPVLEQVLGALPPGLPCPVVIAQHMPVSFTKAMSERLDGLCAISVVHGEHGMPLHAGSAYVIPGAKHGRVRAIGPGPMRLEVSDDPKAAPFKPSANELVASASRQCGKHALAAVLTGLGDDGKLGCQELVKAGGLVLAQDPLSSVVYGMPKAAAEVGGVSMTPESIAKTIASLCKGASASSAA